MGLIDLASGNSLWRGMDYYEEKRVSSIKQVDENIFESEVSRRFLMIDCWNERSLI